MHHRLSAWVIFCAMMMFGAPVWAASDAVTVRLAKQLDQIRLSGEISTIQGKRIDWRGQTTVTREGRFWVLSNQSGEHLKVKNRLLFVKGKGLSFRGKPLPGSLKLTSRKSGQQLMARVDLEDYIVGVVSNEMPQNWPDHALKAQAVAARSYVLAVKKDRIGKSYDVEATVMDQVFRHSEKVNPRVDRLVKMTAGEVLTLNPVGSPLKTFYHSDCGGETTTPVSVWGFGKSAGTIKNCPSKRRAWSVKLTSKEIMSRLLDIHDEQTHLTHFEILETRFGRVNKLRLQTTRGEHVITGQEFRQALGFDEVRSTRFDLHSHGKTWVITGRGHGHGVGLCQWGAMRLAKQGLNYSDILQFYYPQAIHSANTKNVAQK